MYLVCPSLSITQLIRLAVRPAGAVLSVCVRSAEGATEKLKTRNRAFAGRFYFVCIRNRGPKSLEKKSLEQRRF